MQDDPIKEYVGENHYTDTVSSFLLGLFSGLETAKLFYTADRDVLLDVILRRLTDYGPGDKVVFIYSHTIQLWSHFNEIIFDVIYREDLMPCSFIMQSSGFSVRLIRKTSLLSV